MKTTILLSVFAALLFITEKSSAQFTFQKSIGGTAEDFGVEISATTDGGYILVGTTASFGAGGDDIYLIRFNHTGDTLWSKTYGGTDDEYGSSVKQTSDGGFIISGDTKSFGVAGKDAYLIKTDAAGTVTWSKTFGSTGNDYGNTVVLTTDGGYLVAGTTENIGAGNYNVYFVKTNSSGDTLWTKTYGGALEDDGNSVRQTSDDGFILVGTTVSFGGGGDDIFVMKTNSTGDTLWTKAYGGTVDDYGFSIKQTTDDSYIVSGTTNSYGAGGFDCYLMKINSSGDVVWTKTFGSTDTDISGSVLQTSDGGYILLGQSFGFGIGSDIYLIKTDAAGDTLWTRIFGGGGYEFESCILQTTDGGYLISAGEESFGPDRNIYLIKTDASGNSECNQASTPTLVSTISMSEAGTNTIISAGGTVANPSTIKSSGCLANTLCTTVAVIDISIDHSLTIFPNPFTTEFVLSGTSEKGVVTVFDFMGREVFRKTASINETIINTENFLPGLYLLQYTEENKTTVIKIVKF